MRKNIGGSNEFPDVERVTREVDLPRSVLPMALTFRSIHWT